MDSALEFLVAEGPGRPATSGQGLSAANREHARALPGVGITGVKWSLIVRAVLVVFGVLASCLTLAESADQSGTSREVAVTGAGAAVTRREGTDAAFAARLQEATAELAAGRPERAIETCRQVLRDTDSSPVDLVATRGEAYRLILQAAAQLPRTGSSVGAGPALFHGSPAAERLVLEERRVYADNPAARVPGLMAVARWYSLTDQPARQRAMLREVIRIIETVEGPRSPGLAVPLLEMGLSRLADATSPQEARRTLSRGLDLDYARPEESAATRSQFYAALGDLEIVRGSVDSGASAYKAAWQTLADAFGSRLADDAFREPRTLRAPDFLIAWLGEGEGLVLQSEDLVVTYTITRDGRLTDIVPFYRGKEWSIAWFSWGVREGFKKARYRPRLSGGIPVDTPDQRWAVASEPPVVRYN